MALHWNAQRQAWEDACSLGAVHLGKGQAREAFIVLNFISFQEKKNDKILETLRSEWCVQGFLLCFFCMFEIQLNF